MAQLIPTTVKAATTPTPGSVPVPRVTAAAGAAEVVADDGGTEAPRSGATTRGQMAGDLINESRQTRSSPSREERHLGTESGRCGRVRGP